MNAPAPQNSATTPYSTENPIDIKEVENSIRNLNVKNRQELRDLFQNPRDHLTAYELTDENLQAFRKLRKFRSFLTWIEQSLTVVNEDLKSDPNKERSTLFMSNMILTARIKEMIVQNQELQKRIAASNVS